MTLRVLSLGAGVQSSTVLLMSHVGDLPPLDHAIFADTGWEPKAVYEWLDFLESVVSVPIHRVSAGNIRTDALTLPERFARFVLPTFIRSKMGTASMGKRQCTKNYKIIPIGRELRRLLAEAGQRRRPGAVEQWFGISLDEVGRMRSPRVRYVAHRYPLIDWRMTRWDCLRWMEAHGFPEPPRSACIGCPFHSDAEWRRMPADEFADAVAFDAAIRDSSPAAGQVFLHRSLKPLPLVDLSTPEDHGQGDLFGNECEGLCGV